MAEGIESGMGRELYFVFLGELGKNPLRRKSGSGPCEIRQNTILSRRGNTCKGPEVYTSLVCSTSSQKKTYVAGMG